MIHLFKPNKNNDPMQIYCGAATVDSVHCTSITARVELVTCGVCLAAHLAHLVMHTQMTEERIVQLLVDETE